METGKNITGLMPCDGCFLNTFTAHFENEAQRMSVCQGASRLHFRKGEVILKQGANAGTIGFLQRGIVKFVFEKNRDKCYIMTVVSGPKLIGQANLFFRARNIFTVVAAEDSDVCFIDSQLLLRLMEQNGKLLLAMVDHASDMFQSSIFNFISLAHNHVYGRIADILVFLWETVYRDSDYNLNLTRKELSEFAACSHENVISVLSKFRNEGLISINGKTIIINDLNKLKEISKNG